MATESNLDGVATKVATHAEGNFESTLAQLAGYLKIPAISCDAAHAADVTRLAEKIREDLKGLGFAKARLLTLPNALPAVAAEWMQAGPNVPTILIYGHLDLQPVKGEAWQTAPHELRREGDRVIARGAADDMGGWVSHLAALSSWLTVHGKLPCNVRLLIEGEEEIGSPNLERYMDAYPEAFDADVMVLTDCENPAIDIPGLTISLRGLLEVELVCSALKSDVHSGLWGNLVPDPALGLMQLISRLVDDDGRLKVGRVEVPAAWARASEDVPLNQEVIRKGARLLEDVQPLPMRGKTPAEWAWRQPAVTVLSTTLPTPGHEKNAVRKQASAILSFRIAPGQTADELFAVVKAELEKNAPGGLKVEILRKGKDGMSWLYEPKGKAFELANVAYEKAWGRKLLPIGIGGSIPFVAIFGQRFSDRPLILNGVMDPETGAHGPNESMHLGVFRKAILANCYLYGELAKLKS